MPLFRPVLIIAPHFRSATTRTVKVRICCLTRTHTCTSTRAHAIYSNINTHAYTTTHWCDTGNFYVRAYAMHPPFHTHTHTHTRALHAVRLRDIHTISYASVHVCPYLYTMIICSHVTNTQCTRTEHTGYVDACTYACVHTRSPRVEFIPGPTLLICFILRSEKLPKLAPILLNVTPIQKAFRNL